MNYATSALLRLLRAPVRVVQPTGPDSRLCQLIAILRRRGSPLPAVRVSAAQARGRASLYPYWGAARYEVRLRQADGMPTLVPLERAGSDRRSLRLARADADAIARAERRVRVDAAPGEVSPRAAEAIVRQWRDMLRA